MYLNHDEIEQLIKDGYMQNVDPSCINAASLDLRPSFHAFDSQ